MTAKFTRYVAKTTIGVGFLLVALAIFYPAGGYSLRPLVNSSDGSVVHDSSGKVVFDRSPVERHNRRRAVVAKFGSVGGVAAVLSWVYLRRIDRRPQ